MKKTLLLITTALLATSTLAATFFVNGVLYGTVCRYGIYYTSYPAHMAQPVGTSCPVRDPVTGVIVAQGVVTTE